MKKVKVTFEFDENKLGKNWFNKYNLESLLYYKMCTNEDLLKIVSYEELSDV